MMLNSFSPSVMVYDLADQVLYSYVVYSQMSFGSWLNDAGMGIH